MTEEEDQPGEPQTDDEGDSSADPQSAPRPRFRAATDEELDPQRFIVSDRAALRARLCSDNIGKNSGDVTLIGEAITQIGRTLRAAAEDWRDNALISNAVLRPLVFGQSVEIELEVSPEEHVQMGIDGERHAPTIEAARKLGDLLGSDGDHLVPKALELGPEALKPYRRLLALLASEQATLEWQVADAAEVVVLSGTDAYHDSVILEREGDRRVQTISVPGRLTMADSDLRKFALTLPRNFPRHRVLRRKHRLRGTYPEEVGSRLRDDGLWDSDVVATIEVLADIEGTTATPREPTYVLVDAAPVSPHIAPLTS